MRRAVTRVFSANDREKNDITNETYNSCAASDGSALVTLGVFVMVVTEVTRGTLVMIISIQVVQIIT